MSITYNKKNKLFILQTRNSTYQMQISPYGHLLHLYYGASCKQEVSYLLKYKDRGFSGNPYNAGLDRTYSLDYLPQEYPCLGTGDFRINAMVVSYKDGSSETALTYKTHSIYDGKYSIPGLPALYENEEVAHTLEVVMEDCTRDLEVTLYYGVFEKQNVVTRTVKITNRGKTACYVKKAMSTALDWIYGDYDWLYFYGRHAMERITHRKSINNGLQGIRSIRGMSSHQYNPFVIIAEDITTEDYGECYGVSLAYSGNFTVDIEKSQYNSTRLVMGIAPELFEYTLEEGESFYAPEIIMSYSDSGLSSLSHQMHHILRHNMCRGAFKETVRPVLINNWEGTYFNFNGDKLYEIAKCASELGIDLFVLDDGWFGKRDDDYSGLGDWYVNEEKLGCSLKEFINKIKDLGLMFGLWFEPEMVSEDSDLYREHPDWALSIPGKQPIRARHQLVLDYSRKEVVDYIYKQLTTLLDNHDIDYIKWDFNRNITDVYSRACCYKQQGSVLHRYMLGLYDLLERLVKRYPKLLIESCSGGGGRFDAGMLHYSPQIWTSDNTDAIDRTIIQEGTSYGYPISAMGAHVSAVPNHQTGRITPLETRGIVAMSGSFGYELDLSALTNDEKIQIKKQIQTYKELQQLIYDGNYYRLSTYKSSNSRAYSAWLFVSQDKREVLLNVVMLEIHGNDIDQYVKLKGLDKDANYIDLNSKAVYSGASLMYAGISIPEQLKEYGAWQLRLKKQ